MNTNSAELGKLIIGMRDAYLRGENAMEYARKNSTDACNTVTSTLIAYDLQAGSYIAAAENNPEHVNRWCWQLVHLLEPYLKAGSTVMEVGVGEATTLCGVLNRLSEPSVRAVGFDISWSRINAAQYWMSRGGTTASLFVGDLFHIPLGDESVDVVYTSHSLEPNGGSELSAISELLRVARKAVVLIEPIFELASPAAQARMTRHGYVKGLRTAAEQLDANIIDFRLLEYTSNPLNPSGTLVLEKSPKFPASMDFPAWLCPLTSTPLKKRDHYYYSGQTGIAYPILSGVPLLRPEHAVIASALEKSVSE